MQEQTSVGRVFALLQILGDSSREWDVDTLAGHLNTSVKTIRRDLQELRSNGVIILEEAGKHNRKRYWIERNNVPELKLTYDEAMVVFLSCLSKTAFSHTGLELSAASALRKLKLTLGESEANYVNKLIHRFHFTKFENLSGKDQAIVDDILVSMEDSRAIFIEYLSASSTEPLTYDIHPYGIAEHRGSLYVVGHSCHHSEIRTWKVDRVLSTELTLVPFKRPTNFKLSEYFGDAFAVVKGDQEHLVRIRFTGTAVQYVSEKMYHPSQQNTLQGDGSIVAEFCLSSLLEIQSWVLSFGSKAQVIAPDTLRDSIQAEIEMMKTLYNVPHPESIGTQNQGESS